VISKTKENKQSHSFFEDAMSSTQIKIEIGRRPL
jgi:hypothetical protein